jgi:hypothetical protein
MADKAKSDRLLSRIIVYGFSLACGAVIASLEALRSTAVGFAIVFSWRTLLMFVVGTVIMVPCFLIILHSKRTYLRRAVLAFVTLVGLGAFFYPMRVVPGERMPAVSLGLAVAVIALSVIGGLLLMLRRFFESDETRHEP